MIALLFSSKKIFILVPLRVVVIPIKHNSKNTFNDQYHYHSVMLNNRCIFILQ